MDYTYLIPTAGIIALIFVFIKNLSVSKKEIGNAKMAEIAKNIAPICSLPRMFALKAFHIINLE